MFTTDEMGEIWCVALWYVVVIWKFSKKPHMKLASCSDSSVYDWHVNTTRQLPTAIQTPGEESAAKFHHEGLVTSSQSVTQKVEFILDLPISQARPGPILCSPPSSTITPTCPVCHSLSN